MEIQDIIAYIIIAASLVWAIIKIRSAFFPSQGKCEDCNSSENCGLKSEIKKGRKVMN